MCWKPEWALTSPVMAVRGIVQHTISRFMAFHWDYWSSSTFQFCKNANRLEPRSGPTHVGPDLDSSLIATSTVLLKRKLPKFPILTFFRLFQDGHVVCTSLHGTRWTGIDEGLIWKMLSLLNSSPNHLVWASAKLVLIKYWSYCTLSPISVL